MCFLLIVIVSPETFKQNLFLLRYSSPSAVPDVSPHLVPIIMSSSEMNEAIFCWLSFPYILLLRNHYNHLVPKLPVCWQCALFAVRTTTTVSLMNIQFQPACDSEQRDQQSDMCLVVLFFRNQISREGTLPSSSASPSSSSSQMDTAQNEK